MKMTSKQSARFERFSENCSLCAGLGTITRFYGGGIYTSTIECERCLGRGRVGNCTQCKGTGTLKGDDGSTFTDGVDCPACRGVGSIGDCRHCGGIGILEKAAEGDPNGMQHADCPECDGFG